jgi:hypothetical protein
VALRRVVLNHSLSLLTVNKQLPAGAPVHGRAPFH